jgi:cellulose synthase/poly-beta-1,6-N-acetylglucosamine synthase-like glycosyltransferase
LVIAEIARLIFYFLTGLPVAILVLYGAVIVYFNKKRGESTNDVGNALINGGSSIEPLVSIVVATHNEEMIISKKIDNLLSSDYPASKIEIIFVDDSDDSTPKIILAAAEKSPNIHLLRFEKRMGYSPSMLAGCKAAQGEILILNDAGSFIDTHAISKIVCRLRDPKIGVVTGNDVILNVDEEAGKSENLYAKSLNFLRISETNMGSTFFIKGEATGVRKSVVEDIEDANETFDTTTGLYARQKGFKVVYDPEVKFYEYAPDTRSGSIKQKTIRAANLIKVLWRFRGMMFKRKYGKYGSITLPFNFASITILPVYILFWFLSLTALTFLDVGFFVYVWVALGIFSLLLLVFSTRLLLTFLQLEYSLLQAIFQVVFVKKSHDKIDTVASTRR